MSDIAVRVENLGKSYRIVSSTGGKRYKTLQEDMIGFLKNPLRRGDKSETFWALKDVSFEVKHGEVLGIIGRNGAGKSTLLKILSRITRPTTGYADVYGRVGSLLEVGTGFHPELTGRENIYLNGAILGMSRAEISRRFDEIVAFAEVEQFLDTPAKRYSSGMYMRLAFAVAAHLDPEVLIVDEVLAVGDAEFQKKCLGKMSEVASSGRTVLFVSHNMNAVEQLCSSAILLDSGHIAKQSHQVRSITTTYLTSEQYQASEWVSSGTSFQNAYFIPQRMAILSNNNEPMMMPMRNDCEAYIAIEGELLKPDPGLNIGYAIFDESNQLLYWSCFTDVSEDQWPNLTSGYYVLRSIMPKHLLNEGHYLLKLIGGLHSREWFFHPDKDVPSIQMSIQGGLSASPFWIARRPGLLAPILKWEVITSQEPAPVILADAINE